MNISTESDWSSEPWCLDIPYAYKHFGGKDLNAAIHLFLENALKYQEDILFMPVPCFRYYVLAYASYLLSGDSRGDSDGANCFFMIVEHRMEDIRSSSSHVIDQITKTLEKLNHGQAWYDADEEIYGSFETQAGTCLNLIRKVEQSEEINTTKRRP